MTSEEPEPNPTSDHVMDWLEDSVPFLPSFLDDPYSPSEINGYQWWDESQADVGQDLINIRDGSLNSSPFVTAAITTTKPPNPTISNNFPLPSLSKKRKFEDKLNPKPSQQRKNHGQQINQVKDVDTAVEKVVPIKKSVGHRRSSGRATGNNCNNSNNKDGRWAEQLLNPCAIAITEGNFTRVQHLLFVLKELASLTGDANHRLAFHGLRALTHHISSSGSSSSCSALICPAAFASAEPRFFQKSLIKFSEVSPWFAFPNNIANSSILQLLAEENDRTRNLHILDIGVSHGVQWPILLEALTRRPGGPPPLVRITVIAGSASTESDQSVNTAPFSIGPPGDNFSSRLLGFAKSMNINLHINRLDNQQLQNLNFQIIDSSEDETLIICAQFRLHHLNHNVPDERSEFLKSIRKMGPKGVILSENNTECSCSNCGDFATGFSRRVEYLWRFLDSTSSAFKGRESEGRRVASVICVEDGVALPTTEKTMPFGGEDISRCLLWTQRHHQTWPQIRTDVLSKPIDLLMLNRLKESYCEIEEGELEAVAVVHSYEDNMPAGSHKTRLTALNVPPMGLFCPMLLVPDVYPLPPRSWFNDYEDMLEDTWQMDFPRRTEMPDGIFPGINVGLPMWDNYPVFATKPKKEEKVGLAEAITSSILSTGRIELQRKLFCSIQLIGGVALTVGLVPAVEERVLHAIPSNEAIDTVEVLQSRTNPTFVAWKGGAILGILDFGRDAWIHREDWIRNGIHIGSGRKYKDSYFLQAQAMCYINS